MQRRPYLVEAGGRARVSMGDAGVTDKVQNLARGRVSDGERLARVCTSRAGCVDPLDEWPDIALESRIELHAHEADIAGEVNHPSTRRRDLKHL